jgi:hypothetical protein
MEAQRGSLGVSVAIDPQLPICTMVVVGEVDHENGWMFGRVMVGLAGDEEAQSDLGSGEQMVRADDLR